MAFGKKASQPKTQTQVEGQELGRSAYGDIQPTYSRVRDLAMNPDDYRQSHINDFFNTGASWNDTLTQSKRALGQATANNYNAMNGGYSSAGQKYYNDTQKGVNDYNARLYDAGVQTVNNMLGLDSSLAQNAYKNALNQWGFANEGDQIDTYNNLVKKANNNSWTGLLNTAGDVASMFGPIGKGIGAAMKAGAWAGSTNYDDALNNLRLSQGYAKIGPSGLINGVSPNAATNYNNLFGSLQGALSDSNWYQKLAAQNGWGNLLNQGNNNNELDFGDVTAVTRNNRLTNYRNP